MKKQTEKSHENLKQAIAAAGRSLKNIVMLQIYKINYRSEDGHIISEVLRSKFGAQNPPSATWLSVNGLANKGFMIEIEAQAII